MSRRGGDAGELHEARDEIVRLQQLAEAQERHIAVLSAGNDENLRRQIAMQERLNALDYFETEAQNMQRLQGEASRLRQVAAESEERAQLLERKLVAAEQTVATLRRNKQDRSEDAGGKETAILLPTHAHVHTRTRTHAHTHTHALSSLRWHAPIRLEEGGQQNDSRPAAAAAATTGRRRSSRRLYGSWPSLSRSTTRTLRSAGR